MKILLIAFILNVTLFANGSAGGGFDIMQLAPIVLIFVIFYFLIMRPQQKKAKSHQEMLKELRRGDKVVTAGGIIGTVDKIVNDSEISLEIAENVKVRILKATISNLVAKTHPVSESKQSNEKNDSESKIAVDEEDSTKSTSKTKSAKKNSSKSK